MRTGNRTIQTTAGALAFMTALFLLTACSSGLDGTWADETGIMEYRFMPDGRVYASALGMETELQYEINDNKVKIMAPGGNGANQVLTLQDDGSLSGPMGIRLGKQENP